MLRVALCDDSPVFLKQVEDLLLQWPEKPSDLQYECFSDGDALLRSHTDSPYDIILLDILMPLLNGIDTAKELRLQDSSVKIVFLTSSPEFAVESYTVKASNYLLKPIDSQALHRCLDELSAELLKNNRAITVRSVNATHRVDLGRVEYIEAQNKHLLIVLSNGRTIDCIEPLYSLEDKLPLADGFFKCHRSYIVNIHHVDTYSSKEIRMRSGYRIPIARTCQREFEDAYFTVLFGKAGDIE